MGALSRYAIDALKSTESGRCSSNPQAGAALQWLAIPPLVVLSLDGADGRGAAGRQAAGWLNVPISRAKPRMCVLMVKPTTAARTLAGRFKLRTSNAYTVS